MNPTHLVLEALACRPTGKHPCIHSNIPSEYRQPGNFHNFHYLHIVKITIFTLKQNYLSIKISMTTQHNLGLGHKGYIASSNNRETVKIFMESRSP